jgi:hypothetical protein
MKPSHRCIPFFNDLEEPVMLNFTSPHFLRRVLQLDALSGVACGLLMTLGADLLAPFFGLPRALLMEAGLALFPIAAFIGFVATRERIAPALVWIVIAGNAIWAADSFFLLISGWVSPTAWGQAFVIGQALVVAVFAELEFFGLRRRPALA